MNNRKRIVSAIAAVLVVMAVPVTASAEATLTLPPEPGAGIVLDAEKASLSSILDQLATRTGMIIKGRRHVSDREISGHYEGDMPVVLETLLNHESYMVILGPEAGKGYTPIEKIIFTGQSERVLVKRIAPAITPKPDEPKVVKARPKKPEPTRIAPQVLKSGISPPPPPVPPQIDPRVLQAISRPPADTPEGERFDAAVEKISKELEEALAPLRNLR